MGHYKQNELKKKDALKQNPKDRPAKILAPSAPVEPGTTWKEYVDRQDLRRYWEVYTEKGYF